MMRRGRRFLRDLRIGWKAIRTQLDRSHPILAHIVPIRRCNLSCRYCNEYDTVSPPVPTETVYRWVDKLGALGTDFVTVSGGEPFLHPELDGIVCRIRSNGMVATLITNGYFLSRERIERLNRAGLDHLQISIDNVEPDSVSVKSLRLLEPKLGWLAAHADFTVSINSVLGSGVRNPEDAAAILRRATELGFTTSFGILHDGEGQLRPLSDREMAVFREINEPNKRRWPHYWNARFQENLALGLPNEWSCRAGSRYLYVDESGIVSYCSQQRGTPGVPLEAYTKEHIRHEFGTRKSCAPYCTVNCVQQVALADTWRSPQRLVARLPPRSATRPERAGRDEVLAG